MGVFVVVPRKYEKFIDEELSLVKTIYGDIAGFKVVKGSNPRTYLSSNTIEELNKKDFEKLVVMDALKPSQLVNLARSLKRDVVDRIMVILEIFASHAGSREAQLQIELARLKHTLPLVKEAIRYAKLGELHGFLGAGRYGYERYYLMLKRREARVRREIQRLREIRSVRRKARLEAGYPHVAIVGYTCAGKTSLFNVITGLSKPVGPEPFTTLTPKAYKVNYKDLDFILVDTVGFIRDIPPEIIEAFYATLEEVAEAELIINVVDASKPLEEIKNEISTCNSILDKIGARNIPVIYALNKIDVIDRENLGRAVKFIREFASNKEVIPISCKIRENINLLLEEVYKTLKNSRGVS